MPSVSASWLEAKAPSARRQLADHVVEHAGRDLAIALDAEDGPGVQVRARELGVVVEHLLEVGHEPALVGRVAVEAAAELVADAAVGHLVERERRPSPTGLGVAGRDAAEQVLERHRLGELGRAAPRPVAGVERRRQRVVDRAEEPAIDGRAAAGRRRPVLLDERGHEPLAAATASPRSMVHAFETPSSTWLNDGIPWRGRSGKYVPP